MVPWEIHRWNSTAAWRCALVVRMLSTATVEGKQLFPRVRLHAFEVGRIHAWDDRTEKSDFQLKQLEGSKQV